MDIDGADDSNSRRSARIPLKAEVLLRRSGQNNYVVSVHDVSRHGCRTPIRGEANAGRVRVGETSGSTIFRGAGLLGGGGFRGHRIQSSDTPRHFRATCQKVGLVRSQLVPELYTSFRIGEEINKRLACGSYR